MMSGMRACTKDNEGVIQMKYVVITADDFGMARCVNDAIRTCMKSGVVMSTNVMMNMPYAGEAADVKRQFPMASVGLHYTFTVGHPLTGKSTLMGDADAFHNCRTFRKLYHSGRIDDEDIIKEMTAQYNRFIYLVGHAPDYWNSHENVHVDRKLYQLFRDTSLSLHIKAMRSCERITVAPSVKQDHSLKWRLMEPFKQNILSGWQNESRHMGIHSPDGLLVCLQRSDKANLSHLFSNIHFGSKQFAEIPIHPATSNQCEYFGAITDKRVRELQLFSNSKLLENALSQNIRFVNFAMACASEWKGIA